MKNFLKILLSISLLVLVQIGFASTIGTEDDKVAASSKKQQQEQQQTGLEDGQEEKLDQEPVIEPEELIESDQDSVEDDSVSKYNFIFYFLYKFKYDHEETL